MNIELVPKNREQNNIEQPINFQPNKYEQIIPLKRILVAAGPSEHNRNCFGTAQFLNGDIKEDIFQDAIETIARVCNKEPATKPNVGDYIVLNNLPNWKNHISHMGVIVEINPLMMMHRSKQQGPLRVDKVSDVVEHFDKIYKNRTDKNYTGLDIKYYSKSNKK